MAKSVDFWRGYFSGQNLDICDIIENAIIVAALDYPKELRLRRDHIAEFLFTSNLTKCFGCDRVELSKPINGSDKETLLEGEKFENSVELEEGEMRSKESNVECFGDDDDDDDVNVNYIEAEALDDEVEEESHLIEEVVRIKGILDGHKEESDSTVFDSLGRLQRMDLSVEILKATEIGKSVNGLKKHGSKQIRDLVHALIEGWISLLDSWMNATAAIAQNTSPESMKTSNDDFEEGLASPPLDEGAFFAHSVELPKEKKVQQTMKEETVTKKKRAVVRPNKPSCAVTGSTRAAKTRAEQKVDNEMKCQLKEDERAVPKKPLTPQDNVSPKQREQQSDNGAISKKTLTTQQVIKKEEASVQVKLEARKRKLQERYQEAENAKKQRTIQVMELHHIPKQQGSGGNHLMKHDQYNHKKNGTNGRH